MHEFDFISRYVKPLTGGKADALGLADDAAVMGVPAGMDLVLTKDMLQEGVHFVGDEPARLIAKKLLRTNLSDLAAMGAKPYGYLLGLGLPSRIGQNWMADFAAGLAEDNALFGVHVLGGDTTRTKSHISLSLAALGHVPQGHALQRCGAREGDKLYMSGTLGDAALGLRVKTGEMVGLDALDAAYLLERYHVPQPRLALGQALRIVATSCMDISDGLLQDAGHIAGASEVGITIWRDALPLSVAALQAVKLYGEQAWQWIVAGGDDYELLVTLPPHTTAPEGLTCIGEVVRGSGVVLVDENGVDITPQVRGYQHF